MRRGTTKTHWRAAGLGLGLLVGALVIAWVDRDAVHERGRSPDARARLRVDGAGHLPTLRGRGEPTEAGKEAEDGRDRGARPAATETLAGAMRRLEAAWAPYETVIDGVPERMEPDLLAVIARDDALYETWVELWHAFDSRSCGPRDRALRLRLESAFDAYQRNAPSGDPLLEAIDDARTRLAAEGPLWLDVLLVDEVLPRLHDALGIQADLQTDAPAEARRRRLAEALRTATDRDLADSHGRFARLGALAQQARARSLALRDAGVDLEPARPFGRWAVTLRTLLCDPSPNVDTRLLSKALAASPSARVALGTCFEDVERTTLRRIPLRTLQRDGRMQVPAVNRVAREHVDRCLAFLSLLEVDTPDGRMRLYGADAGSAGARLYLLVSAACRRLGAAAFPAGGAAWFARLDDEALADALSTRYEDLEAAREAMWESLAVELQAVVRGGSP